MYISKVQNAHGAWLEKLEDIEEEPINFFQNLFVVEPNAPMEFSLLHLIFSLVFIVGNDWLASLPSLEEIKKATFSFGLDSAPSPNGFSSKLFSHY